MCMQVVFHVATLMPTTVQDPKCNNKKLHIGNDHVVIVFKDGFALQVIVYFRCFAKFLFSMRFQVAAVRPQYSGWRRELCGHCGGAVG